MWNKKRRAQRNTAHLPLELALYSTVDDSILAGPAPSFLLDISYYGAGLILPQIYFAPHHLFYAPLDNEEMVLCLEKKRQEGDSPLNIPVKPIWFRLGENETSGYFMLGIEFQVEPEDSDVISLEKMALSWVEPQENLAKKLFRVFR